MAGFPVCILLCSFPGRWEQGQVTISAFNPHVSGFNFQVTKTQARPAHPRRAGAGETCLLLAAQVHTPQHFTPLKRFCPNCQQCVTNRALPENGSKTLCNEWRSCFQKGQHLTKSWVLSDPYPMADSGWENSPQCSHWQKWFFKQLMQMYSSWIQVRKSWLVFTHLHTYLIT